MTKNDNKRKLAEIQALAEHIAMMKCTVSQLAATKRNQEEQDDDAPRNDVGNQFGSHKARLESDNYPLCLEKYLVLFMQCINSLQRQQRDLHQYGCYNIKPGLQGTVDLPAAFSIRLVSAVQIDDLLQLKEDVPSFKTFHTSERKSTVSASDLSERWFIGWKQATQTTKSTSQRLLRSAILPLAPRYRAHRMYERPRLCGVVYTDTMHGHFKSLDGNKYAQIFATEDYFAAAYPMESKTLAGDALKEFITDYGVPDKIIMDSSGEQTGKRSTFMEQVQKHHIDYHVTEPEQYNQSRVEGLICEIRKKWFRVMTKKYIPKQLWDYELRWVIEIMQRTASDAGTLHGRTGLEKVTGETPEIFKYTDFGFYDPCWYKENTGMGETKTGRWLGVSHKTRSLMSFWILTPSCRVVSRTSVKRITNLELQEETNKRRMTAFDDEVKGYLFDYNHVLNDGSKPELYDWSTHPFEDDPDFQEEFDNPVNHPEVKEADELFTPDTYDQYLQMELALPQSDSLETWLARVTK